jgi:hypothetical protein
VEQENDKRPSPGVLYAVLIESIALVCKVKLGLAIQVGKVKLGGIKRRVKRLSVEDTGAASPPKV